MGLITSSYRFVLYAKYFVLYFVVIEISHNAISIQIISEGRNYQYQTCISHLYRHSVKHALKWKVPRGDMRVDLHMPPDAELPLHACFSDFWLTLYEMRAMKSSQTIFQFGWVFILLII